MTWVNVKNVNRVTAKGRVYYYHRPTGQRIHADPGDAEAFAAAVTALEGKAPVPQAPKPGTLGGLIALYKAAPEFATVLSDSTRISYNRAFDAIAGADEMELGKIDQPWLLELRDEINTASGRWLANNTMRVLSVVFGWGIPRGILKVNPAKGIPKIKRRKGLAVANKSWLPDEVELLIRTALAKGHVGLAKAVAVAYYAALRKTDCVGLPAIARQKFDIVVEQSKTGTALPILQARRLRVVLDTPDTPAPDDVETPTLVRRRDGRPYTVDGLDSLFDRLKRDLAKAGKIRKGLTFHGLRKSLGKRAADLGFSTLDIMGALGQTNPASALPYVIEASREKGARRVFKALEKKR